MNSERKAQFLRRAENRRLRSIARDIRKSKKNRIRTRDGDRNKTRKCNFE